MHTYILGSHLSYESQSLGVGSRSLYFNNLPAYLTFCLPDFMHLHDLCSPHVALRLCHSSCFRLIDCKIAVILSNIHSITVFLMHCFPKVHIKT